MIKALHIYGNEADLREDYRRFCDMNPTAVAVHHARTIDLPGLRMKFIRKDQPEVVKGYRYDVFLPHCRLSEEEIQFYWMHMA